MSFQNKNEHDVAIHDKPEEQEGIASVPRIKSQPSEQDTLRGETVEPPTKEKTEKTTPTESGESSDSEDSNGAQLGSEKPAVADNFGAVRNPSDNRQTTTPSSGGGDGGTGWALLALAVFIALLLTAILTGPSRLIEFAAELREWAGSFLPYAGGTVGLLGIATVVALILNGGNDNGPPARGSQHQSGPSGKGWIYEPRPKLRQSGFYKAIFDYFRNAGIVAAVFNYAFVVVYYATKAAADTGSTWWQYGGYLTSIALFAAGLILVCFNIIYGNDVRSQYLVYGRDYVDTGRFTDDDPPRRIKTDALLNWDGRYDRQPLAFFLLAGLLRIGVIYICAQTVFWVSGLLNL